MRDESKGDAFEAGREAAEDVRRELEALRDDVRTVVRDEVRRAGVSRAELERMVEEIVEERARERAERVRSATFGVGWSGAALLAAGVAVGIVAGTLGYRAVVEREPGPAGSRGSAAASRDTTRVASDPAAPATPSPGPAERAALYDSLLQTRSERLEGALARLERAGPAGPVLDALSSWRRGADLSASQWRRLHDGLVQLALNEVAGAELVLDGLVSRDPCGGSSCGALLELWESRGDELGLPARPAAANDSVLAVAERALVLGIVDPAGPAGEPGGTP